MDCCELPFTWVQAHGVLLREEEGRLQLCCRPDASAEALLEAWRFAGDIPLVTLQEDNFRHAVSEHYQNSDRSRQMMNDFDGLSDLSSLIDTLPAEDDLLNSDDGAPVIRLLNAILSEAIQVGASDIHIEPFEKKLAVRFRIDGMLREILTPPAETGSYLISRIKVMARLDIAEKRLPQDGRISLKLGGRNVDVRVSTLPASFGERVVMRVLDKNTIRLELGELGLAPGIKSTLSGLLQHPHGILLVTGPTGSGKSTTLYASLSEIDRKEKNILTVEDPVEYELEGIGQTQVNARVDMTFARGLRAILRQDPDVVMIGEIRDSETAQIAVQASLTGHLVLSTLHTNTALGAVERLRDMGVEPFLLASSLSGVLAQRLVRRLCLACREKTPLTPAERQAFPGINADAIYRPRGCDACHHTGYRGRTGVHELLTVSPELRDAISRGAGKAETEACLCKVPGGYQTLFDDAQYKISLGLTSIEEMLRITKEMQIHEI